MDARTVVVTGGARGLGKAIGKAFGERGDRIALVDILPEALQETVEQLRGEGITVIGCPADTTDQLQVDALPETVEAELGPADILINNAGTFSVIGPVWEVDPKRWFRDITTNLY